MPEVKYSQIFSPRISARQRQENFENYLAFTRRHAGDLLESEQDLTKKRALLQTFRDNPVRSRQPLRDPEAFYRNYIELKDEAASLDLPTALLTSIYKFARHEWVGVSAAWAETPTLANSRSLTAKISRYHLAEEFCHIRLFHEMFRTMQLDRVEWRPLGPMMQRLYHVVPHLPAFTMDAAAFVTELMGIVFYTHIDAVLDDVLRDEPEARDRIRTLLHVIMVDELAHVGQRRNFIGPIGIRAARLMVRPIFKMFFRDIPESSLLFDVDRMIDDARAFDYTLVQSELIDQSWIPSYCHPIALTA